MRQMPKLFTLSANPLLSFLLFFSVIFYAPVLVETDFPAWWTEYLIFRDSSVIVVSLITMLATFHLKSSVGFLLASLPYLFCVATLLLRYVVDGMDREEIFPLFRGLFVYPLLFIAVTLYSHKRPLNFEAVCKAALIAISAGLFFESVYIDENSFSIAAGSPRYTGPLLNPNALGWTSAILSVYLFNMQAVKFTQVGRRNRNGRRGGVGSSVCWLALSVVIILMSGSRSALIALLLGILSSGSVTKWVRISAVGVGASIGIGYAAFSQGISRFFSLATERYRIFADMLEIAFGARVSDVFLGYELDEWVFMNDEGLLDDSSFLLFFACGGLLLCLLACLLLGGWLTLSSASRKAIIPLVLSLAFLFFATNGLLTHPLGVLVAILAPSLLFAGSHQFYSSGSAQIGGIRRGA